MKTFPPQPKDQPDPLDIRLQNRDTTPLPVGALIRFQFINRGKSPSQNVKWLLLEDGTMFKVVHSGDPNADYRIPFDQDFPEAATFQVLPEEVSAVQQLLGEHQFLTQETYQLQADVEGGAYYVVTARLDSTVHEVIYEAYWPSLLAQLYSVLEKYVQ